MWVWFGVGARGQDTSSGADLLDMSRRAAIVDEVLSEHLGRMRTARTFGAEQRFRMASNLSFYSVGELALTTEQEGTFPVELARSYTGFLLDVLGRPHLDGSPAEQVFYLTGGGIAYGLDRPFELPLGRGTDGEPLYSSNNDLVGTQYSDEQYAVGGRWAGFHLEGAWAHGQRLEATADGRADLTSLEERTNRAQVSLGSPFGLRLSSRWALGGPVENLAVGLDVNDAVDGIALPEPVRKTPVFTVGFRKSDYEGQDARSHPRIFGVGVSEDLRWLFTRAPEVPVDEPRGSVTANVRTQADFDVTGVGLQLALAEAEFGWFGRGEVAATAGASWYQDPALQRFVGERAVAGGQGGLHLAYNVQAPDCGEAGVSEEGIACVPNLGMRAVVSVKIRESWAEELRYVSEYAGKPQTYGYFELMGGF
ncbi:MAG: hypothetical protein ABMA64_09645 [Myxococcota bacterium]